MAPDGPTSHGPSGNPSQEPVHRPRPNPRAEPRSESLSSSSPEPAALLSQRFPTRALAEEAALVLASQDIPHQLLRQDAESWLLAVPTGRAERAAATLHAYIEENAALWAEADRPPSRGPYASSLAGLWAVLPLPLWHIWMLHGGHRQRLVEAGASRASAILEGEVWRTVTALSLHGDWEHVLANCVSGGLLFTVVCRVLGPGLGIFALLAAGAGGNMLNALAYGRGHSSIGASTAVFGAIGLLAGLALTRRYRIGLRGGRAFLPVMAGFGLLVLLGMGEDTDILAHVMGFVVAVPLGPASAIGCANYREPGVKGCLEAWESSE